MRNRFLSAAIFICILGIRSDLNGQMIMPPAYNSSTKINYVRTWDATAPIKNSDTLMIRPVTDVQQTTQYLDALGRPLETVLKQYSATRKDLVQPVLYDAFGRQSVAFLSFASSVMQTGDLADDGGFKMNPFQQDSAFNKNQFAGESYYYSLIKYESSPLNRPSKLFSPGNSWVGSQGTSAEKGIEKQYSINTVADSVRNWSVAMAQGSLPITSATYGAGQLSKDITIDESGHKVIQYTDGMGHIILQKRQLASSPGTAHVGWLCSYYVYDDLGNLRYLLQPKAVELLNGSWSFTQPIADELCFRFEYDGRHRAIIRKDPGLGETWMVYDARSRVVMTQDSNLRSQGKWLVVQYDAQNRQYRTGLWTDANGRSYHQNLASSSISYPNTSSNYELLTELYYDDYSWVSGTGTTLTSYLDGTYTSNSAYFITTNNTAPYYAQAIAQKPGSRGLLTGMKTKVLGTTNQYLYAVTFYDEKLRTVQIQKTNITGGRDVVTTQYDFAGKLLRSLVQHQKSGTNAQTHLVLSKLEYDHVGRVKKIWKNIDGASSDQLIDSIKYNELGQIEKKYLGSNIDSIAYDYNIRGWLTGINKKFVGGGTANYFGEELGYDNTVSVTGSTSFANPQFNGLISGAVWKTLGDTTKRKYDFTYDNVNQLTGASFVQNAAGTTWNNTTIDYSVSNLSFDANGNLLSMTQRGYKVNSSVVIDSLFYSNNSNSNKLASVTDLVNDAATKLGDFHYSGGKGSSDYGYDGNGNILYDNNKAISGISYNLLNQTEQVNVTGKGSVKYVYDASGTRLQKIVTDNTVSPGKTVTTVYIEGFVYRNDTLQFVQHEEGRARWAFHKYLSGSTAYRFEYDFMEKDHLGNTRMVLTQQKDTAQYLATMESAYRSVENQLFYNIAQTAYPKSLVSGYPVDNTTNPNDSLIRVNGNGPKQGPGILLKVMSGDKLDLAVKSYYRSGGTANSPNSVLTDILSSLATGLASAASGAKGTVTDLNNTSTSPVFGALQSFTGTNNPTPSGKPKAYLNWILLDEQLNYVSSYPQSGAVQVGSADALNTLATTGIPITKNGYLYVWVSNETPGWDVFFDNLSVRHYAGSVLEETHYYPFGLTMAAISSNALKTNYAENKFRYNEGTELQSGEFSDGSGLELYETPFRSYDPQIGRFQQFDPLSLETGNYSPYAYANNNSVNYNDPLGLKYRDQKGTMWHSDNPFSGISVFDGPLTVGGGGDAADYGNTSEARGSYSADDNGIYTTGGYAQQLFAVMEYLYNHPADDGYADITIGFNNQGQLGYWGPSDFNGLGNSFSAEGLQEVISGAKFYTLDGNRPSYQSMYSHYPGNEYSAAQVYEMIGGKVLQARIDNPAAFENSCALRMSRALNYSGVKIPAARGKTLSGSDGNNYFYRVADLKTFLTTQFGKPDVGGDINKLSKYVGIIVFGNCDFSDATGHLDMWNGSSCKDECYWDRCNSAQIWTLK